MEQILGKETYFVNVDFLKLEIYIPQTHLESLQIALQHVDAGHIGNYDCCLSYSPITSTWRPLEGTHPYAGEINEIHTELEYKVEVTIRSEKLDDTIASIKDIHPYEEPVINVIPLYATGIPSQEIYEDPTFKQLRFDDQLNIVSESCIREMSAEERAEYDRMVEGATQMSILDLL